MKFTSAAELPTEEEPLKLKYWELDRDTLVLYARPYGSRYEVDLEKCLSPSQILDWVSHVGRKTWCSAEMIGELLFALDRILDMPSMCGGSMNGRAARQITKKYVAKCVEDTKILKEPS